MLKTAVLIPCYNEEKTIAKVIKDFKKELPKADIYVYNNNSTDRTYEIANKNKAIVVNEYLQGKGNVVRSMFRDIEADIYILVDGDDTYPAEQVKELMKPVEEGRADMVIGDRLSSTYYSENKRPFHNFGNDLVRWMINFIFNSNISDVMTGYRVFSRRFVKSIAILSEGFEIETEMTAYALNSHMNIVSLPVDYRDRPEGSVSKLNTFKDGAKVLFLLLRLALQYRPFISYTFLSLLALIFKLIFHFGDYLPTGLFVAGLILQGTKRNFDQLLEKANQNIRPMDIRPMMEPIVTSRSKKSKPKTPAADNANNKKEENPLSL